MKYQIRVHRLALVDLHEAYDWAYRRAPNTADKWYERFLEAIRSMESAPTRCGLAVGSRKVSIEIRELHFGRRPNVFRVIFHIDGDTVRVLRIRRGQRRSRMRLNLKTTTHRWVDPRNSRTWPAGAIR